MTAYGRADHNTPLGSFSIEIHSVNRKFLDIQIILPQELSQFELEIRKWIIPYISRGLITIKAAAFFEECVPFRIKPNLALARQFKAAWEEISHDLQLHQTFELSFLSQRSEIFVYEENQAQEENYREMIKICFEEAMNHFLKVKINEGSALQKDIQNRIQTMRQLIEFIQSKTPSATMKYREKLLKRLEELLPGQIENEERILREVALFAEKIDIMEEITRFSCHLTHFEELMHSSETSVGKTLEFITQELNREVNTIGSKSLDLEIARTIIEIKTEIERIREQIQNIE
jgi:uncharacterized protein (TIGR00255 family)